MTHLDIIITVVTLSIASTLGVYVAIKKINQYTRTPLNTLRRETGDIELNDLIEPRLPEQVHHFMRFERISDVPISDVSYRTNFPTSDIWVDTSSPDGDLLNEYWFNINSCLENDINIDFIWGLNFIIMILIIY